MPRRPLCTVCGKRRARPDRETCARCRPGMPPRLTPEQRRSVVVQARITQAQYDEIERRLAVGASVSSWVRDLISEAIGQR